MSSSIFSSSLGDRKDRAAQSTVVLCALMAFVLTPHSLLAWQSGGDRGLTSDFVLPTYQGRELPLHDQIGDAGLVIVFLGTECPLAKLYGSRLSSIADQVSGDGVSVLGVMSNSQDSMRDVRNYVERHRINFPIVMDVGNRLADALGAERTPEVFLLDAAQRLVYRGRIDDQYGVGYAKQEAQVHFLSDAISELVSGREISRPETVAIGCFIGRIMRAEPTGAITYHGQIAPIFDSHCVWCHHSGTLAPFALSNYDEIVGWGETILEVVENGRMPPWFANPSYGEFSNDCRLSDAARLLLRQWVANGMPKGQRKDPTVVSRTYDSDWRIGDPDLILSMEENFEVAATGVVENQEFEIDPKWTEDQYIEAVEVRPGNSKVVHHIIAYLILPDQTRVSDENSVLGGFVPGVNPRQLHSGYSIHAPAGSRIVLSTHYTSCGERQFDNSSIALRYCKDGKGRKHLRTRWIVNSRFKIPPNNPDFRVVADYVSRQDETLLALSPHMHLRGKSFRFTAQFPNGNREILLDVPKYDFNWQISYELAHPKLLPRGTRVECEAYYDNSEGNPVNPDPSIAVGWGAQTWDEMMIGFMQVAPVDYECTCAVAPAVGWRWILSKCIERAEYVYLRTVYVFWVRFPLALVLFVVFGILYLSRVVRRRNFLVLRIKN